MNQEVTPWRTTYTKKYAMASSHTYGFFTQSWYSRLHRLRLGAPPGAAAQPRALSARAPAQDSAGWPRALSARAQRTRSAHVLSARPWQAWVRGACAGLAAASKHCPGAGQRNWAFTRGPAGRRQLDTESCTYCWGGRIAARLRGAQPPLPCT